MSRLHTRRFRPSGRQLVLLVGAVVLGAILVPASGVAAGRGAESTNARAAGGGPSAHHFQKYVTASSTKLLFGPAAAKDGLAISSVTVSNRNAEDRIVSIVVTSFVQGGGRGATCSSEGPATAALVVDVAVLGHDTVHLDVPEPVVATGSEGAAFWCAFVVSLQPSGPEPVVNVVGVTF